MTAEPWSAHVAETYDDDIAFMYAPEVLDPAVTFLADVAGEGAALEFAVGTGRVAIPLSATGLRVVGIELSEPMVDELLAKDGSEDLEVVVGDMTGTRVPGRFGVVYLVFNGVTCLLTQAEQVECFRNAARHLQPGGAFVVEAYVPRLALTSEPHASDHGYDTVDPITQLVTSYLVEADGPTTVETMHRYVWPSELDLMANLAGLELEGRWADWEQSTFAADSGGHVSVWRTPQR